MQMRAGIRKAMIAWRQKPRYFARHVANEKSKQAEQADQMRVSCIPDHLTPVILPVRTPPQPRPALPIGTARYSSGKAFRRGGWRSGVWRTCENQRKKPARAAGLPFSSDTLNAKPG